MSYSYKLGLNCNSWWLTPWSESWCGELDIHYNISQYWVTFSAAPAQRGQNMWHWSDERDTDIWTLIGHSPALLLARVLASHWLQPRPLIDLHKHCCPDWDQLRLRSREWDILDMWDWSIEADPALSLGQARGHHETVLDLVQLSLHSLNLCISWSDFHGWFNDLIMLWISPAMK